MSDIRRIAADLLDDADRPPLERKVANALLSLSARIDKLERRLDSVNEKADLGTHAYGLMTPKG